MNVHVSYRRPKTPAVEKDIQHQIEKLRKRLQVFRPELVHLKGLVEENSRREGTSVSLNLRLPSGQMAVEASAPTATTAVKTAFDDLLQQVNKHKEILRSSHKWSRGGARPAQQLPQVPFEQTLAAVHPPAVSAEDIGAYVNVNLSRLRRYVEREIYFREASDLIAPDSITQDEVIDETIAAALGDSYEKPERLALEPWLYQLALRALDALVRADQSNGSGNVHLEESARKPNVKASDEPELQFHQPDESFTEETVIADGRLSTPEQIAASDEILHLIASALRDVSSSDREVFILHAIEGFGVDEIAAITGHAPAQVLASISAAREHLSKSPGLAHSFQSRLIPKGAA